MSNLPRKMCIETNGHTVEGDVVYSTSPTIDNKVQYSLSLTNGRLLCGPHDAEGNHIKVAA